MSRNENLDLPVKGRQNDYKDTKYERHYQYLHKYLGVSGDHPIVAQDGMRVYTKDSRCSLSNRF